MNQTLLIVPIIGLLGLLFTITLRLHIIKRNLGNQKVREIADVIVESAKAFLTSEHRILIVFVASLFIVVSFGTGSWVTAGCFLMGNSFFTTAGYLGMSVAIRASCRTANAARISGMRSALVLAFSGGSVMGMAMVGLELTGVGALYMVTRDIPVFSGSSLGASSIAPFIHVGGSIYTKAADMGADLVGEVEAGIPKDDPRNPAVITDNAGGNVGDVAGMGASLFESYVGSLASALTLGLVLYQEPDIIFPLLLSVCDIVASIIGTPLIRVIGGADLHKVLETGEYSTTALVVIAALALNRTLSGNYPITLTVIIGLFVGVLIRFVTEIYALGDYQSVKKVADQSETGSAATIINGLAVDIQLAAVPILLVCVDTLISNRLMGLYGIALVAVGTLSTTGITVAIDAYGSIAGNAGGIAEMAGLDKSVREIADRLGLVGSTTAATGKGSAIDSVALTALALFVLHTEVVKLTTIDIPNVRVIMDLFIGGMLTFPFSAVTMKSVPRAAHQMIEEVRRQFRENPQVLQGNARPDYVSCVSTSTTATLEGIFLPGLMAVLTPLATGITLGPDALGGLLAGSLITGVLMAISMSNSGEAWNNAKKYIGEGNHGGKRSTAHKAAVVGDTVGDPFEDTSGPSINILIKLMTIVSLVFAPLFL